MSELIDLIEIETRKPAKDFYQTVLDAGYELGNGAIYKKALEKIELICDKGHSYKVRPSDFKTGKRCRECSYIKRGKQHAKTDDQFKHEVYDLVGKEYSFLGKYDGNKTKISVIHNKCGLMYEVSPNSFLRGTRCPECSIKVRAKKRRTSNSDFRKRIYDLVGDEYSVLNEYTGASNKVKMKHNKCGHKYDIVPSSFLRGTRCPACCYKVRELPWLKTEEQFKQEVYELVGSEYQVLTPYTGSKNKITLKHNQCGLEYEVIPNSFLRGRRCPHCSSSKGESAIQDFLEELGEEYEAEYSFNDLKYKELLRVDFFLPKYNLILEFDGKQHFYPIEFFGGLKNFEVVQKRDSIKDKYAEDNGINLLRIPYWDIDNVEEIIADKLNELTETLEVL